MSPGPRPHRLPARRGRGLLAAVAAAGTVAVAGVVAGCGAQSRGQRTATATVTTSRDTASAARTSAGTTTDTATASVTAQVAAAHVGHRTAPRIVARAVTAPAIVQRDGSEVAVYERLTIEGHPYLFRLDTGDSRTVIYADAAAALHLPHHGSAQPVQTVGCTISDQPVRVHHWRLGSLRLPPATIIAQAEPGELSGTSIGGVPVAGLLGNDVLARLHRITIEYRRRRLIIGSRGHRGGHTVRLTVHRAASGAIDITTRATVHGVGANYLIDTGAPFPLLSPGQSSQLGLSVTGAEHDLSGGAGCTDEATPVRLDDWRIGSLALPATTGYAAADAFVVPQDGHDVAGLIDGGTLSRFGQVTFEYGRGRLVLGGSVG